MLDLSLNEIVAKFPETITIFNSLGFDTCCAGAMTLRDAIRKHKLDEQQVLASLDAVVSP